MQLSKQEFSKLSKADQSRLANTKKQHKRPQGQKRVGKKGTSVTGNNKRDVAVVAFSKRVTQFNPRESSKPNGARCIKFKEYVQDIPGSVAFAATQFQCNPGLNNLFAWLSGQALFYQEYTVKNLKFTFETEKATSLSGKVMYAFLQDSADPLPASKQEMLENLIKASGAIWEPFVLPVNMGNFPALGKSRFIRSGTLAANLDLKTYDIGQLIVATQGMADTSLVGELYVEYDIELRTPLQSAAQLATALSVQLIGVTPSQTSQFGVTPTVQGGLNVTATGNTITFNTTGQFFIDSRLVGTGFFTNYVPTITGTASSSVENGLSNAAANIGTISQSFILVTVSARGQTVIIDNSAVSTTITNSATRIMMYALANG